MAKEDKPSSSEPTEKVKQDVLEQCMGSMGRFHWIVALSIFLTKFPIAWHLISHGIMVPKSTPIYCNNTKLPIKDIMTSLELKKLRQEACSNECPQIIVSNKYYDNSIVHQFKLYCGREELTTAAQFVVMGGVLVGNTLFGIISDRFGRKIPLIICCVIQPFCGLAIAFIPNIYSFLVFKFVLNLFVGGTMITGFVLFCELVGIKWRATMGILYHIPFALGHLLLALFGYIFRDWRWFQLTISLPAIFLIAYYWFIPESPRWLIAVGQTDRGIKEVEYVARRNKLPTENIRTLVEADIAQRAAEGMKVKKGKIYDLFKTKNMLLITLGMWVNWFNVSMCFYGVAQYVGSIGSNVYLNFAVTALIQLPGVLLLFIALPKLGRKWSVVTGNIISLVSVIIIEIIPYPTYKIIPATSAMFGLAFLFVALYVYSCEVFPTVIRNVGIGSSSSAGRVGAMLATVVADSKKNYDWLPTVVFSLSIFIAALMSFVLPETKGKKLPDNLEDIDELMKKHIRT